jgi:hypothetical protein
MKSRSVIAAFAAVLALASVSNAFAGERLLGATLLSGIYDRDIINVPGLCPSPANPMVRSVQLTVRRRAAQIDQLEVRYGNGVWDNLPVRERFTAGSSSRWIDLRGGERCVEAIRVVGNSEGLVQSLVEIRAR